MRILIVSDAWHPQVNGVVRTLTKTREVLEKRGHVVEVIGPGEFLVVPKGVEHRPVAPEEVELLIMDREGEPNTGGEAPSELTRAKLETLL